MECEIAAHGAPYCTRSSSKKKKKKPSSNVTRGLGRGRGGERMGRRRGQGRAGAGQAELERGPDACAPCLESYLQVCTPGSARTLGASGPLPSRTWIVRRTFFLSFFVLMMTTKTGDNSEKGLSCGAAALHSPFLFPPPCFSPLRTSFSPLVLNSFFPL